MYYGWADGFLSELGIDDYNSALEEIGNSAKTQNSLRLFMVPGMGHCSGGPGADTFGQYSRAAADTPSHNIIRALESWVEQGVAPEKIIATKYVENTPKKGVAFTRPLCVYPKVRVYDGKGDINKASSFECKKGAIPQ